MDVQFTDYHPFDTHKFVTIILKEGEIYEMHDWQRTEEGWHSEDISWELEDGVVTKYSHSDGVDCDGRLEQACSHSCPIKDLQGQFAWLDSEWIEGEGAINVYSDTIKVPVWENYKRSQRDYTAESMGY